MSSDRLLWTLASGAAAMGVAFLTRHGLRYGWNAATGEDPPLNPASASTAWGEALTWTVAASLVAGVSRLVARRTVATVLDGPVPSDRYDT